MGTQSCKGCYDLTERNAFDAQYSTAHQGFQLLCRCCGLLLIIDIRCGWSCQQITVYGRADQNTLPILVGSWKMVWLTRFPASLSSRQ